MFRIKLKFVENGSYPQYLEKVYDYELDNYVSVLCDICDIFEQSGMVLFSVSGFGQDDWLTDCKYDLLSVMEQVPEIILKFKLNMYDFELFFYEQGLQRLIKFEDYSEQQVQLSCTSFLPWRPNPEKIVISKTAVNKLFIDLYEKFLYCSERLCSNLITHSLLKTWLLDNEQSNN